MNNYPYDSGPIAPERNPPINPEYYQPRRYVIESITMGPNTLVTTTIDNDFVIGQLVRMLIPYYYGAQSLNNVDSYVISLPASNQVLLQLNSSNSSPFALDSVHPLYPQEPQIIPVGDINSGPINATGLINQGTYIEGSFINISPN